MLIIGDQEASDSMVSVRKKGEGDLCSFSLENFAELLNKEIEEQIKH